MRRGPTSDRPHQQQPAAKGLGVDDAHEQRLAQGSGIDHLQVPVEIDRRDAKLATLAAVLLLALDTQ